MKFLSLAMMTKKLMTCLEECDINAEELSSNCEFDGFSSDNSEGIVLHMPPKSLCLRRRWLNLETTYLPQNKPLYKAGDEKFSNNADSNDEENDNDVFFSETPADQNYDYPNLPVSFMGL